MAIAFERVTFGYGDTPVLKEVSITLPERGGICLRGASGCGKSVTLKCIAGIMTPDRGHIILNGETLFDSEKHINLPPQKRRVGYLFQRYALFPSMTVLQNIRCGIRSGSRAGKHGPRRENDRSVQHPRGQMPALQVKVK